VERIISILEDKGLFTDELAQCFAFHSPLAAVNNVREELQAALDDRSLEQPSSGNALSAFNFLASASLRGQSVCDEKNCRLRKVARLARYSALYCDRVLVPIQFIAAHEQDESDTRYGFWREVATVLELRPLIEAGIIYLLPSFLNYCPHCMPIVVPERPEINTAARGLTEQHAGDFSLVYGGRERSGHQFTLQGPAQYLEHGQRCRWYARRPTWLPKEMARKGASRPAKLPAAAVRQSGMVHDIFDEIAEDATLQQFYAAKYDTKYLTDRLGEAEFLNSFSKRFELAKQKEALCAHLAHSIPLFSEVPIETVVRIRREDNEAFQQYRSALGEIVKQYVSSNKEIRALEAKQIYFDELEPRLRELQRKARSERRAALKKGILKTAATTALVGLGIYSGILPPNLIELCKSIGGVKLAADVAEIFASIEKHPPAISNNNLYFLLRVKEEADR
jgi:hypothetical protein